MRHHATMTDRNNTLNVVVTQRRLQRCLLTGMPLTRLNLPHHFGRATSSP
jgi:hypothetical protein